MKIQWKDDRKNGGPPITRGAFADLPEPGKVITTYKPTFTIAPYHHDGLYSMEQLFLEHYTDPTEYTFVQDVFEGDLEHWEAFKNSAVMGKYYKRWKRLAEAKLSSEVMNKIVQSAFDENNRNSFQALKYLVDRCSKSTTSTVRGRPKKEKTVEEVDSADLLADIARLKGV